MEQLLNWMELNPWIVQHQWVVTATCDAVAYLCLAGMAGMVARGRSASIREVAEVKPPLVAPLPADVVSAVADDVVLQAEEAVVPPPAKVVRKDVKRALEAIGRWEHDYGKSRGLQELANMVEAKRKSQPRIPAAS